MRAPAETTRAGGSFSLRSDSALLLTISRGQSRFPNRPVLTERFLIGGSPSCDLCLSGREMPPMHSIIVRDGDRWHWETMMSHPGVRHNGRVCDDFDLRDGDLVRLGGVEFAVRIGTFEEIAERLGIDVESAAIGALVHEPPDVEAFTGSTAVDLVDRLERDLNWIDDFDRRRHLGAEAVLDAAHRMAGETAPSPSQFDERPLLERLERLAAHLARCAAELQHRADEMAEEQRTLIARLGSVLNAERNLTQHVDSLVRELALPHAGQGQPNLSAA